MSEPTREQPVVSPEVTTRSPWHVSRIPAHLGRARTSTVVLSVLFVVIFALYLNVKPDTSGAATTGTSNQAPVTTEAPASGTTPQPPTRSSVPTTTPSLPTPSVSSPSG
jgi:hypothetical protein